MKEQAKRRDNVPGPAGSGTKAELPVPAFLQVMPAARPRTIRRIGTIRTLCPRKNLGVLIDTSSGGNALFAYEDISASDRQDLREGDTVTYVAVVGPDGAAARQVCRDLSDIPPPPSEILHARGWR